MTEWRCDESSSPRRSPLVLTACRKDDPFPQPPVPAFFKRPLLPLFAGERGSTACRSMDPLAKSCLSQADRNPPTFSGRMNALGATGGDTNDQGCSRDEAMGGSDSLTSFADVDDSLEEKLKGLAFRKQTSYR